MYTAFGSKNWIRKMKPRKTFQKRKTPAHSADAPDNGSNYSKLLFTPNKPSQVPKQPTNISPVNKTVSSFPLYIVPIILVTLVIAWWLILHLI